MVTVLVIKLVLSAPRVSVRSWKSNVAGLIASENLTSTLDTDSPRGSGETSTTSVMVGAVSSSLRKISVYSAFAAPERDAFRLHLTHPNQSDPVAKPNFGFQKRQREQAKERKKQDKMAKKAERAAMEQAEQVNQETNPEGAVLPDGASSADPQH